MAAPLKDICRPLSRILLREKRVMNVMCIRNKIYDSNYIESTRTYESIMEPVPNDDIRRFKKIMAACTDDHTFIDYDPLVLKFTNMIVKSGRKNVARDLVERAFEHVKHIQVAKYHKAPDSEKASIELDPVKIFYQALENGKPLLMTTKVRKVGQTHLVPVAATPVRQKFLAMKWLIEAGKDKPAQKRFYEKLGEEILNAYNHEGGLIRRKQDLHKLCESNRAVVHFW